MSEKEGKYMMQAEEFINIACNSGYATKKNAKKYTEKHTKDSYSDSRLYWGVPLQEEKERNWSYTLYYVPNYEWKDNSIQKRYPGKYSSGQDWIG